MRLITRISSLARRNYFRVISTALAGFCALLAIAHAATPETQPAGIQKPGIQIPFTSLKADAEFPLAPAWMLPADALIVPDPSGEKLLRIELKNASKSGGRSGKGAAKAEATNPETAKAEPAPAEPAAPKSPEPIPGMNQPCSGAVSAFGSLWVMNCGSGTITRINLKAEKEEDRLQATIKAGVDHAAYAIAATSDSIWALTSNKTTLSRIDPAGNRVVAETRLPAGCNDLRFGEQSLWISCPAQDQVLRVNPATNLVDQYIKVAAKPSSIAIGANSIWVLGLKEGKVDRIDPKTNKVTKTIELNVAGSTGQLAFGEGSLWVTLAGFPLTRIDPESNEVLQQFKGKGGGAIQTAGGAVWLSNVDQGTLWKLDPKRVQATLAE